MRRWLYRNVYLQSPYWRFIRWLKLRVHGRYCDNCHRPLRRLDIHHTTYRGMLFREWYQLDKLRVLCRVCHDREHERKR